MAKATVTKQPVKIETVVEQDFYTLTLTRDEALAIFALTGKVGVPESSTTMSPRAKELGRAAQAVYWALEATGKISLADSFTLKGTSHLHFDRPFWSMSCWNPSVSVND